MSVTCPHCSGDVDEDFGLVECPHCNMQFMVSVDGDVEVNQSEANQPEEYQAEEYQAEENPAEYEYVEPLEEEPAYEVEPEPEPELEPEPEPEPEPTSPDISNLANDSESVAQESSPYVYSINIKGIDTADIRRDLKDTLLDMRLRIDLDAIINSISQGELTIEGISSVKAALIVQRLRALPIEISWRQRRA